MSTLKGVQQTSYRPLSRVFLLRLNLSEVQESPTPKVGYFFIYLVIPNIFFDFSLMFLGKRHVSTGARKRSRSPSPKDSTPHRRAAAVVADLGIKDAFKPVSLGGKPLVS